MNDVTRDTVSAGSPPGILHVYRWMQQPDRAPPELVVLCLHGFTGGGLDFEVLFDRVDTDHDAQIWSVDLIGHGDASAPEGAAYYSTRAQLEQLDDVIDFVMSHGGKRLVLLGYSMGGRLALQWAVRHGERLDGLVLISASPGIEDEDEREARRAQDGQLCEMIASRGVQKFLEFWRAIPLLRSQEHIEASFRATMLQRRARLTSRGLIGSLQGFGAGSMPPVVSCLSELDLPTLYLCGRDDTKYHAIGKRVCGLMPRCELHIVDDVGHSPHLEAPDEVWPVIARFLEGKKG